MPDYGRGKRPLDKPTREEERMRADRDAIYAVLDKLTNQSIRTIVEHGERVAKGSVEGERISGGKGEVSRPTERVALEGLPNDPETADMWRERRDHVGKAIAELRVLLSKMAEQSAPVGDKAQYVLGMSVDEFEHLGLHKTAAVCRACDRKVTGSADDRLREGYCDACRKAWKRRQETWTQPEAPDRGAFERERKRKADEERKAS